MECLLGGGIANPLEVIEQITYLLFMRGPAASAGPECANNIIELTATMGAAQLLKNIAVSFVLSFLANGVTLVPVTTLSEVKAEPKCFQRHQPTGSGKAKERARPLASAERC
jgi:hypothetical protein